VRRARSLLVTASGEGLYLAGVLLWPAVLAYLALVVWCARSPWALAPPEMSG